MKYINVEKLIAEIERRLVKYDTDYTSAGRELKELLSFIASLQQEQPEVDLDKEYNSYIESRKEVLSGNAVTVNMKDLAHHFYELGFNARKEE